MIYTSQPSTMRKLEGLSFNLVLNNKLIVQSSVEVFKVSVLT